MYNNPLTICVLGGMGTYATINLFRQYAEVFPAKKEWERPRIIIDNNCTMPSRVVAWETGNDKDKLVEIMTKSIKNLILSGGENTKVILACNTSHLFLPYIYEKYPEARKYVLNIIDNCVEELSTKGINSVFLLASEGTIDSEIYQTKLRLKGIVCKTPTKDMYSEIRTCIEAVKQNSYSDEIRNIFLHLLGSEENIILGCTELPILYEKYSNPRNDVYDPLLMAVKELRKEYEQLYISV